MIESPFHTGVGGRGSIFDIYIEVKYGSKEWVLSKFEDSDDYDDYPEREANERDSESGTNSGGENARSGSENEVALSSSEAEDDGVKERDQVVPSTSDGKTESGDKSTQSSSDAESEVRTRETGEVNNQAGISVAAAEDKGKLPPKDLELKPKNRRRSTKNGPRPQIPYQSDRPIPPGTRNLPPPGLFPRPAEVQGMRIYSPHLLTAIRSLVTYYPAQLLTGEFMPIGAPFKMLFHYHHDLERLLEESQAQEAARPGNNEATALETDEFSSLLKERIHHLLVLLDYLRPKHLNQIKPAEERFRDGVSTYEMIWLLLKPGCDVYGKVGGMLTGFVFASAKEDKRAYTTPGNRSEERVEHYWAVKAWHLCYINGKFVRTTRLFKIVKYDGEQDITTLAVFPCQYLDRSDGGKTRRSLERRGRIHFEYLKAAPLHIKYKGPAWDHRTYPKIWKKEPKLVRLMLIVLKLLHTHFITSNMTER